MHADYSVFVEKIYLYIDISVYDQSTGALWLYCDCAVKAKELLS